jgi:hypothetical protein
MLTSQDQNAAINIAKRILESELGHSEKPDLQLTLFDLGPYQRKRLLFIFYPAILNIISVEDFLNDFRASYWHFSNNEGIQARHLPGAYLAQ